MTLGGLLKHLAACEDYEPTQKCRRAVGNRGTRPGAGSTDLDVETAADDDPEYLYELWDGAVRRSRERLAAALADGGLDQEIHASEHGRHANLRRLVCDLIEEYGRHTGHADLIREAVDGRVGEDPPDGWSATSGSFGQGR